MTQRRRDDRGAAAVEFALVVPILLALVFGIIVYGMIFAQSLSLSNSARQSARLAVVDQPDAICSTISSYAQDAADTLGMDGDDATVTIKRGTTETGAADACTGGGSTQPCKTQPVGTKIYVRLVYTVDPVVPMIPTPDSIDGKGVFRCEFQ